MRLDTPQGLFTVHTHQLPRAMFHEDERLWVMVQVHRGPCVNRLDRAAAQRLVYGEPLCGADSPAIVKLTLPVRARDYRHTIMRAASRAALAKGLLRLGLGREERRAVWAAYFAEVAVLPRRCIAVVTTCPRGHRHRVAAVAYPDWRPAMAGRGQWRALGDDPAHPGDKALVWFPSAREVCGAAVSAVQGITIHAPELESSVLSGHLCDLPTLPAKHRYLFAVDLPLGRAAKRRLLAARPGTGQPVDTSQDDVPY